MLRLSVKMRVKSIMAAFAVLAGLVGALSVTTSAVAQDQAAGESVIQILSYRDGDLLNQGSGVVVGSNGEVLTSAHLLHDADQIVGVDATGASRDSAVIASDTARDLAFLSVDGLGTPAASVAVEAAPVNETLFISGYWATQEDRRAAKLFGRKRPKFLAEIQSEQKRASATIRSYEGSILGAVAIVGRGAYGAPVVDDCGDVSGIVRGADGADIQSLWAHHTPPRTLTVAGPAMIAVVAASAGVELLQAASVCEPATQAALREAEADKSAAAAAASDAKRKLEEERKKREEAEQGADEARLQAEETEADAAETREALDEFATKSEEDQIVIEQSQEKNRRLIYIAAGAIGGLTVFAVLLTWLVRRRKKDKIEATAALNEATARYNDCQLDGVSSSGDPVAIKILGGELQHAVDGVIVGRNPDESQFVIGDETISRRHARFFLKDGHVVIEDLDSTSGTKLNGAPLAPRAPAQINSGDFIELGGAKLTFRVLEE